MSRECELLGIKPQTGHNVPVNRSQTGVRSNRRFDPNIQKISFNSEKLGNLRLRVAVKTLRTIEHKGGFDKFLLNTANRKLTTRAVQLKKKVFDKLTEAEKTELTTRKTTRNAEPSKRSLIAKAKREAAGTEAKKETKAAVKKAPAKKAAAKKED